jgi:hypothetical protein
MNLDELINECMDVKAREKGNGEKKIVLPSGNEIAGLWVEEKKIVIIEKV